ASWPCRHTSCRSTRPGSQAWVPSRSVCAALPSRATRLGRGRLVILGAPGAGKTVLANQLLLDLADRLLSGAGGRAGGVVVPVRMSLPAFDPAVYEASAGDQVASRLESWMAQYLADVFGLQDALAQALIRRGGILPVLDGLDEMDRDDAGARRAAAVIRG